MQLLPAFIFVAIFYLFSAFRWMDFSAKIFSFFLDLRSSIRSFDDDDSFHAQVSAEHSALVAGQKFNLVST